MEGKNLNAPTEPETTAVEVPAYTLRADRRIDLMALIGFRTILTNLDARHPLLAEIEQVIRDFELYQNRDRQVTAGA